MAGSSVNESCAQDTQQIHGRHGSGALLNPVSCRFLVCSASVELVDKSLDEWSSSVVCSASVELVGGRDAKSRVEDSLRVSLCVSGGQRQLNCGNSLNSRLCRAIRLGLPMEDAVRALQQQVNALMA